MSRLSYYVFFSLVALLLSSCGASKSKRAVVQQNLNANEVIIYHKSPENKLHTASASEKPKDNRVYNITSTALKFEGTKYKFGGTTEKGMDCSGLVFTSFLEEDIELPRTSRAMSLEGERLSLVDVNIGDLLFFETNKNKKVINHVGLVVEIQPGHILFIHSSTSKGVIISSLADNYWFDHFVMARRVI
ncbi:C40 family peptidase [Gillisia sp. CAL575]|uniref:C40 family peptidase n=1 Tax=Gillisia sp. CAL575 TaxID=985255 RepID=UPI00039C558E|nr:C40 family peptidase [Gillisia sp. CAL575]